MSRTRSRCAPIALGLLLLAGLAAPAEGAPGDACVSGFERGQEARKQARFVKARGELRMCLSACPEILAAECRAWLADVDRQIGRLHVEPRDAQGNAVEGAVLEIDGEPAQGPDIEIDPGPHAISVKAPLYVPFHRDVEVAAGAAVRVDATLAPLPPPTLAAPPERVPIMIGLTAAGGLSLLLGGGLLLGGKVEEARLASTCRPNCSPAAVVPIEQVWIAGGIAAGAGTLSIAAALLVWTTSRPPKATAVGWSPWVDPRGAAGVLVRGDL